MSLGTRIGIYRYLSAHAKSVWLLFCNAVGYETVLLFFPLSDKGSDEQGWDKSWCLLPGIGAVLEAIEKCGEAGRRQSD